MAEQREFSTPATHIEAYSLGIAGRTARLFISSPVTPMLLIAALLVGLMGLFFTPRQEDPQEVLGVNNRVELSRAEEVLRQRL